MDLALSFNPIFLTWPKKNLITSYSGTRSKPGRMIFLLFCERNLKTAEFSMACCMLIIACNTKNYFVESFNARAILISSSNAF